MWYEFAVNKSSAIIDNYDQIYQDLLPFRKLSPQKLRESTNTMVTDAWNDVAAIHIRGGVASFQEDVRPTHRWMLEGTVKLVSQFSQYLPDMDLALNINDEARVAVPWEDIDASRNLAKAQPLRPENELSVSWSADRASNWPPSFYDTTSSHRAFVDRSMQKVFDAIGRSTCPPSSVARSSNFWEHRSLCLDCAKPHSLDQFMKDWDLASDICHQPDIGELHGFYLSPSAFKVSQDPLPVFSQSKPPGFNDILYPSPWGYVDKAKYEPSDEHPDPPYAQKEPTLFWRGATSEGYSTRGQWRGMVRQRLVHVVNDHTSKPVSVLLPSSRGKFAYENLAASSISTNLNLPTLVNIADEFVRCDDGDCEAQKSEYGTAPRTDFQEHWKYRFLFDVDGAGFSGRFLPFLQSHSLPFRSALYRTWIDGRLTEWVHFVPIDLRLHGLWSTLAYFAGAKRSGKNPAHQVTIMEPRDKAGEFIAEEGRKWAEKTLRKEDMEVYFFRLLLEWGRLTDDRRDELGFRV